MTDRHDDSSRDREDELVRQALMSLMDDVAEHPLPEPSSIRARAEGGAEGGVVDLAAHRRRRSLVFLAGVAAAALVATGAGLLVANQSPDTPVATSSTATSTGGTTSATSAAETRLTMLESKDWEGVLGVGVASTRAGAPEGHCFEEVDEATWSSEHVILSSGGTGGGQWIGMPTQESGPLGGLLESTVDQCETHTADRRERGDLPDGAAYSAHHVTSQDGTSAWWVEVTDGDAVSVLSVEETGGRSYTAEEVRRLALGVIGEVDLSEETDGPRSPTPTWSPSEPPGGTSTTTTRPSPAPSSPSPTPSGSSTSGPLPDLPSPPPLTPTPPEMPPPTMSQSLFVPGSEWASRALTGSASTRTLKYEKGGIEFGLDSCAFSEGYPDGSIMVGTGQEDAFGGQHIFLGKDAEDADRIESELRKRYDSGSCPTATGSAPVTSIGDGVYKITAQGTSEYSTLRRMSSHAVTVVHFTESSAAPEELTDEVARAQLTRIGNLAARR